MCNDDWNIEGGQKRCSPKKKKKTQYLWIGVRKSRPSKTPVLNGKTITPNEQNKKKLYLCFGR